MQAHEIIYDAKRRLLNNRSAIRTATAKGDFVAVRRLLDANRRIKADIQRKYAVILD